MKQAYPIILTPSEHGYVVYVPDLDINTEGRIPPTPSTWPRTLSASGGSPPRLWAAKFRRPLRRFPSVRRLRRRPMPWWTLMLTTAIPYDCPAAPASAGAALFHVSDSDAGSVACSCRKVPRYSRLSVSAEPLTVVPRLS